MPIQGRHPPIARRQGPRPAGPPPRDDGPPWWAWLLLLGMG